MNDFAHRVRALVDRAESAGWTVTEERSIPYGRLVVFTQGGSQKATLSCYHGKRGFKTVFGGREGGLLAQLLDPEAGAAARDASSSGSEAERPRLDRDDPFGLGTPRIGGDESGKGDYFGPLVVAAWHLVREELPALIDIGVTDSKRLRDPQIQRMAGRLEALERGHVVWLDPPDYNQAYRRTGNLNLLLAELHGQCVTELVRRDAEPGITVLIDQFAARAAPLRGQMPRHVKLVTRTKGEADPAVAAASILARASFVEGLRRLEHEFGCPFPPGAGTPVLQAGRAFVQSFGRDALGQVAKVHFATTRQLG